MFLFGWDLGHAEKQQQRISRGFPCKLEIILVVVLNQH